MPDKSSNAAPRPRRITIKDVARAAGISIGAASAALRDTKTSIGVSRETRERVRRLAQELGYRPNAAARAMAAKSFRTVGVLAAQYCFTSYYSYALRGLVAQAEELGYHVVLKMVPTTYDLETARIFSESVINGIIIPAESEEHTREALRSYGLPHVWLNAGVEEPYNCVLPDEQMGMQLAIAHLVKLGHRRIAYMPQNEGSGYHTLVTREKAFLKAMADAGLEPMPTYARWIDIAEHVDLYMAMSPRPTAIIACTDAFAAWTVNALIRRNFRIPEDLSVVGAEGVVWHRYVYQPLTTVLGPVHELGRAAMRMLVQQIETGRPIPSITLPVSLLVNASTGPAPTAS